ncbi:MAG: Trm112 family protein [bacterium]
MNKTPPVESATAPDPAFLRLLCCPLCEDRPPLEWERARNILRCSHRGHEFPFGGGENADYSFPDLRPSEEATPCK